MLFLMLPPKDRIRETSPVADPLHERDVRVVQVPRPPAKRPCVERDEEDLVSGILSAREKRDGDLVVFRPVELEPAAAGARGGGDVLDGGGRGCGEYIREAELCGDSRNPNFLIRVEDFLNA